MQHPREVVIAICVTILAFSVSAAAIHRYALDLDIDFEEGRVHGTSQVEYENTTGMTQTEVFFHLYPNADHMYGDASLRILAASVDGVAVDVGLFVEDTVLLVPLPEPIAAGETATIVLTFDATASSHDPDASGQGAAYGIFTRSDDALVLTSFYPILALYTHEGWAIDPPLPIGDALTSETSSYDVRIEVDADLRPIAAGTLVESSVATQTATYHYAIDASRDFSLVLSPSLEGQSSELGATRLQTWFTREHEEAAARALDVAAASLGLYEFLVGGCIFDAVQIVEVPLHHVAGVEFSGLILVSSDYAANPRATFFDIIISHEMAHQWFYAAVGNDPIEEPWLDECLATYLSYVYLAASATDSAEAEFASWGRVFETARATHPDLAINRPLYAFPDSSTYSAFVYSGGAVFLDQIRSEIGDMAFFAALASYYAKHTHTVATASDFLGAFEEACSCSLMSIQSAFGLIP